MTQLGSALVGGASAELFLLFRLLFGGVIAFMGLNHFLNGEDMIAYARMKGLPAPSLAVYGTERDGQAPEREHRAAAVDRERRRGETFRPGACPSRSVRSRCSAQSRWSSSSSSSRRRCTTSGTSTTRSNSKAS
jgi:hypothetical protein